MSDSGKNFVVYIPQEIDAAGIDYLKKRGYRLKMASALDPETVETEIAECHAMALRTIPVTRELLDAAKNLRVISRFGVGLDNVDFSAVRDKNIYLLNTPEANVSTVGEHTMALMVACFKNFHAGDKAARENRFMEAKNTLGFELSGKTLGLLGFGKIARDVARKALSFDMKVTAYDPFCNPDSIPAEITLITDRDQLFRESDIISVHIPVTAETKESITSREFALMKKSAYFVNASRGQLVKEPDLYQALVSKEIAGAATDVFYTEPPRPDNPLFTLENLFITPHNAGITAESFIRMGIECAKGIDDVLQGRNPKYPVITPI